MTDDKKNDVTSEEFDEALVELLDGMSSEEILATPGAYEVFSEALNNEAIALAREIKEEEEEAIALAREVKEEEEDDNDDDEKT